MKHQTVLVLGAGASRPFGFPTGGELRGQLLHDLGEPMSHDLGNALVSCGFQPKDVQSFRNCFLQSQMLSIDAFLQRWPEFEIVGKNAIAAQILRFEAATKEALWIQPDWYQRLLLAIAEDKDLYAHRLAIVSFNYDRSLEYYLVSSLPATCHITREQAMERVRRLDIVHFYGDLGPLKEVTGEGMRTYGVFDDHAIRPAAESIHVIGRSDKAKAAIEKACVLCLEAEVVCFIGFGFLQENLQALRTHGWREGNPDVRIHATNDGLEPVAEARVTREFARLSVDWFPGKALGFFQTVDVFA
jgi:hypothetical protein